MDFSQAEEQFNELQARVQRGEPLSEDQYQEELAKLMVQDDHGTFWSLEPGTGRWLYFDGTEWVPGMPPRSSRPTPPSYAAPLAEPRASQPRGSAYEQPQDQAEPQGVEPENVQTYVRAGEAGDAGADKPGGIPPRPVREATYGMNVGPEERPWLPFAFGAVVLLLCAVALFFGTRTLGLFSGASNTPVAKATATEEVLPTDEAPTEEPTETAQPTATKAKATNTPAPAGSVKATTTDRTRMRPGPGTSYEPIITTLDSGTVVTVTGRNADSSWLQIQTPVKGKNTTGWVSKDLVTVAGDLNSVPVIGAPTPTAPPTKAGTKSPTPKATRPTATPTAGG